MTYSLWAEVELRGRDAAYTDFGEVSEWPKEPISKIGRCGDVPRGFESHPLRHDDGGDLGEVLEWPIRHAWKACRGASPSWVRIPPSPPWP